jgi:hypothetical protein
MTMKTECEEIELASLLFEPETASDAAKSHVMDCAACAEQLKELERTMALLDTWQMPEPSPFFMTRMKARLEEEKAAEPEGYFAHLWTRIKDRVSFGPQMLRPVAAMSLTLMLLVGGGAYIGFSGVLEPTQPKGQAYVVNDLQNLDSNAQLLDQLESMSNSQDAAQGD